MLWFEYHCFVFIKLLMFDELPNVRYDNLWTSTVSQDEQFVVQSIEYLCLTSCCKSGTRTYGHEQLVKRYNMLFDLLSMSL